MKKVMGALPLVIMVLFCAATVALIAGGLIWLYELLMWVRDMLAEFSGGEK